MLVKVRKCMSHNTVFYFTVHRVLPITSEDFIFFSFYGLTAFLGPLPSLAILSILTYLVLIFSNSLYPKSSLYPLPLHQSIYLLVYLHVSCTQLYYIIFGMRSLSIRCTTAVTLGSRKIVLMSPFVA